MAVVDEEARVGGRGKRRGEGEERSPKAILLLLLPNGLRPAPSPPPPALEEGERKGPPRPHFLRRRRRPVESDLLARSGGGGGGRGGGGGGRASPSSLYVSCHGDEDVSCLRPVVPKASCPNGRSWASQKNSSLLSFGQFVQSESRQALRSVPMNESLITKFFFAQKSHLFTNLKEKGEGNPWTRFPSPSSLLPLPLKGSNGEWRKGKEKKFPSIFFFFLAAA